MPYSYTTRDLFEGPPFHYMYAPFEGPRFLTEYVAARKAALAALGIAPSTSVRFAAGVIPLLGRDSFVTEDMLTLLVGAAMAGTPATDWVDMFLGKFEPSKRLRRTYDRNLTVVDRGVVGRAAYARLAFLVASALTGVHDLRRLNALLKLNDLVLSTALVEAEVRPLVDFALKRELACVEELARRLKVDVGGCAAC